jgi:protein-tyrosine phosphatase
MQAPAPVDISPLTHRLAVGDGIWTPERMRRVADLGYSHVIDVQAEFNDEEIAAPFGVQVLWNPVEDDFQPKPEEFFARSVAFALAAFDDPEARVYVHCAAGLHRAPLTCAAILCALGYEFDAALELIRARRPAVDFPAVYLASLARYVRQRLGMAAPLPDDVREQTGGEDALPGAGDEPAR